MPQADGTTTSYGVVNLPGGAALMVVAGVISGLLGIGAGAVKVTAMDYLMKLPLKVSSATSNFMIGVTAGAGALVFLSRGDVAASIARAGRARRDRRRADRRACLAAPQCCGAQNTLRDYPRPDRARDGMARLSSI